MKGRAYLFITMLMASQTLPTHAFTIFGYDVSRAWAVFRSYFGGMTPTRPAPIAPPLRPAPLVPTQISTPQRSQPATQAAAARRIAQLANHLAPEKQKSTDRIETTAATGSTITASDSLKLKALDLTRPDSFKIEMLLQNPYNIDPIITLALHTPIYRIDQNNLEVLLSNQEIAQELSPKVMAYFTNLISFIDTSLAPGTSEHLHLVKAELFLDNILRIYPELRAEFTSLISKRFDILMKSFQGQRLIRHILEHSQKEKKDIAATLLPKIMTYFKNSLPLMAGSSEKFVEIQGLFDDITRMFPETKEVFISLILERFDILIKSFEGQRLLKHLWEHSEVKTPFAHLAAKHFPTLAISYQGVDFLIKIITKYPDMAETFFPLALEYFNSLMKLSNGDRFFNIITNEVTYTHDNFTAVYNNLTKLIKHKAGFDFLINLINKHPQSMKELAQPKYFTDLILDKEGIHLLTTLINTLPESANEVGPLALEHFPTLTKTPDSVKLFHTIMDKSPDFTNEFNARLSQHFTKLIRHYQDISFLNAVINTAELTKKFTPFILENFMTLINSPEGIAFIINRITSYPKLSPELAPLALNNFDALIKSLAGIQLLQKIMDNDASTKDIFITKLFETQKLFYPFTDLNNAPFTQTKQLLKANVFSNYMALKTGGLIDYECCPELQTMIKQVIDLEAQEQAKRRYTFVHAHQWQYHFFQEIYTDLWNIIYRQSASAYRFVRFAEPPSSPWTSLEHILYIKEHEKMRWRLLDKSVKSYYAKNKTCQFHMLFMNYGLFVNTYGSNTGNYIKINQSENPINLDVTQLLQELKLEQYFHASELARLIQELKALQEEHKLVSQYGGGLLLSFTLEALKKAVYPVEGGGKKRTVHIQGIGETSDVQLILDTLRKAPERIQDSDKMEFVCVLSHDCTLIPNNGLDIYEFNAADQDKLAEWRKKKDVLMQYIKTIVDQKRTEQQAQQIKPKL